VLATGCCYVCLGGDVFGKTECCVYVCVHGVCFWKGGECRGLKGIKVTRCNRMAWRVCVCVYLCVCVCVRTREDRSSFAG